MKFLNVKPIVLLLLFSKQQNIVNCSHSISLDFPRIPVLENPPILSLEESAITRNSFILCFKINDQENVVIPRETSIIQSNLIDIKTNDPNAQLNFVDDTTDLNDDDAREEREDEGDPGDNHAPDDPHRFKSEIKSSIRDNPVNLDDPNNIHPILSSGSDAVMKKIQMIWRDKIETSSSLVSLEANETYVQSLHTRSTDRTVFQQQILAQFSEPLIRSGRRTHWLDPEFALYLRGQVILAQHRSPGDAFRKDPPMRGLQLKCPSGSSSMVRAVVRALSASVQSDLIILNRRAVDAVRQTARDRFMLPSPLLTAEYLLSALFQILVQPDISNSRPCIILLNDELDWYLRVPGISSILRTELQRQQSSVFFIHSEPDNTAISGNSLDTNNSPTRSQSPLSVTESEVLPNFPGYSPGNDPSSSSNPFPRNLPAPVGQSFQIIFRNGSASIVPIPSILPHGAPVMPPFGMLSSGMMPNGMFHALPGVPGMPTPPEALIRKILEHRQMNGADSGLSEADMQQFLNDPAHRAVMKEFLDNVMKMASAQLPPGLLESQPDGVEVKVHMMSVPVPLPMSTGESVVPIPLPNNANLSSKVTVKKKFPGLFFKSKPTSSADTNSSSDLNLDVGRNKTELTMKSSTSAPVTSSSSRIREESQNKERDLLLSLLPEAVLAPPREHALRQLWDRMTEEEAGRRAAKFNRRMLEKEAKRQGVAFRKLNTSRVDEFNPIAVVHSSALTEILSKRSLTSEEISQAIHSARLLQAGLGIHVAHTVGLWALDAGLCSALGLPLPRLGKPAKRSMEDLFASITDKYERALLPSVIAPAEVGVSYDMIGGLEDVKQTLQQCITYPLKYPRLYREGIAAEGVKGVLLFGPPGTGKTMLAKAVATEGGATFLSVDASTIENKWLGESEKNAKAVFTLARKLAPCVIYLDEVDSLLSSREGGDDSSHGTLTSVKTTLMQEWDGLRTTTDRVVVIASTNRPFDLDEAVLRRLPRRILVDLPDAKTREEILSVSLADNRLDPDVNLTQIASQLEGYTGSDIKEVCREAVVRVSHERARQEEGLIRLTSPIGSPGEDDHQDEIDAPLRAVNAADFKFAMQKLRASVDEAGRETARVIEWNDRYGEVRRTRKSRSKSTSMYI